MRNRIIMVVVFFLLGSSVCFGQENPLKQKIEKIIHGKKATVGVAIIGENGDTLIINGDVRYPMQSTYKFHLALAVLNMVDQGKLTLDQLIFVSKKELLPNTHSPLRDQYPDGDVELPLREIIRYTVQESDNNGCDILFRLAGGAGKVNEYIRGLGIQNINIAATEEEMHKDWNTQYTNWSTPLATAQLLEKFYHSAILSAKTKEFLWNTLLNTQTGLNRLRGLLPGNAQVAHKTGSGATQNGITSACNDIGCILLPDGRHFTIVVYVKESKENNQANERIIAEIAKAAWDYYMDLK